MEILLFILYDMSLALIKPQVYRDILITLTPPQLERGHRRRSQVSHGTEQPPHSRPPTPTPDAHPSPTSTPYPRGLRASKAIFVVTSYMFGYEKAMHAILSENGFGTVTCYSAMTDAAHTTVSICGV